MATTKTTDVTLSLADQAGINVWVDRLATYMEANETLSYAVSYPNEYDQDVVTSLQRLIDNNQKIALRQIRNIANSSASMNVHLAETPFKALSHWSKADSNQARLIRVVTDILAPAKNADYFIASPLVTYSLHS